MHSIKHNVLISASPESIYNALTEPKELDKWWTVKSSGKCGLLEYYQFYFSDDYDWTAQISLLRPNEEVNYQMIEADKDWTGTILRFRLEECGKGALLIFEHSNWLEDNAHFRRTSYCWALYLRCLKNLLEKGLIISYEHRTD